MVVSRYANGCHYEDCVCVITCCNFFYVFIVLVLHNSSVLILQ